MENYKGKNYADSKEKFSEKEKPRKTYVKPNRTIENIYYLAF